MYSKCTNLHDARKVFDEMAEKTLVSWNAMITAYDRSGDQAAAERLFREMPERNVTSWNGMIARHVRVGDTRAAQILFDEMPERDAISWNSMIAVYIRAKNHKRALELFASMEREQNGVAEPNRVTFLGVLIACTHKGLVKEGHIYFDRMVNEYKIEPDVKHYGCMVDLLSRCGMVEEAYRMIKEMPVKANSVMWNTVLAACRVHGNVELGEKAFKEFLEMDSMGDDEVVTMSNIYAETG